MRKVHLILITISLAFQVSCANKANNLLVGKWATFSHDFGYSEFTINDSTIQIFSHWMGNQGEWLYEFINDTIKVEHGYIGRIKEINDSFLVVTDQQESDTIYRLDASTMTFNPHVMTVNSDNDTLFNEFYNEFLKRGKAFMFNRNISSELFDGDSTSIKEEIIHPVN